MATYSYYVMEQLDGPANLCLRGAYEWFLLYIRYNSSRM